MNQSPGRGLGYSALINNAAVNISEAQCPRTDLVISAASLLEAEWMGHKSVYVSRFFIQFSNID